MEDAAIWIVVESNMPIQYEKANLIEAITEGIVEAMNEAPLPHLEKEKSHAKAHSTSNT